MVSGFALLYGTRLLLGAGESISYPCYSSIFSQLPQAHRGRANAMVDAGAKIGPAAGAWVGGLLLIHFGWRALFVTLGIAGMLWLVPWVRATRGLKPPPQRATERRSDAATASLPELLTLRPAWATFLGHFCGNYFFYFLLAWLPLYLVREQQMTTGR